MFEAHVLWKRCISAVVVAVAAFVRICLLHSDQSFRNDTAKFATDSCFFGTLAQPGRVAVFNAKESFNGLLRLENHACPELIQGLSSLDGWRNFSELGDLAYLEQRSSTLLTFDASSSGSFTYWDNSTLFAESVFRTGVLKPTYTKVDSSRSSFFTALSGGLTPSFGQVRFGGPLESFSNDLVLEIEKYLVPLASVLGWLAKVEASLWLSSAGSRSTIHHDSFDNTFVMLRGCKRVLLVPPSDSVVLEVYPGTHPHTRQARRNFEGGPTFSAEPRMLQTEVCDGEALLIPSGWFHDVTTGTQAAVALALTTLPWEHLEFNDWMRSGTSSLIPFTAHNGPWGLPRTAAALRVFVPAVLEMLGAGEVLRQLATTSYGNLTREELGMPARGASAPDCPEASSEDAAAALASAHLVAARLLRFRAGPLALHLPVYLENVFSKIGRRQGGALHVMATAMDFVESCLL